MERSVDVSPRGASSLSSEVIGFEDYVEISSFFCFLRFDIYALCPCPATALNRRRFRYTFLFFVSMDEISAQETASLGRGGDES